MGKISNSTRQRIFSRDHGCCTHCAVDLLDLAAALDYIQRLHDARPWAVPTRREVQRAMGIDSEDGHLWEINHRQAQVDDGPDADDNLELVCLRCHRIHTANVVANRAKARRRQQKFALTRMDTGFRTVKTKKKWPSRKLPTGRKFGPAHKTRPLRSL